MSIPTTLMAGTQATCPHCHTLRWTYFLNEKADERDRPDIPRFVAHPNGDRECDGSHKKVWTEKTSA